MVLLICRERALHWPAPLPMVSVWIFVVASAIGVWRTRVPWLRTLCAAGLGAALAAHAVLAQQRLRLGPADEVRLIADVDIESVAPDRLGGWQVRAEVGERVAALRWPPRLPVEAGERWRLMLQLAAPVSGDNPGSAPVAWQQLRSGLHARGRVLPSPLNQRLAASHFNLNALRSRIAAAVAARLVERDAAALAIALAVGDTSRLSLRQWQVCRATGITHLIAISGLHVTGFCVVMALLARVFWRWSSWLQQRMNREAFALGVGVAASAAYALLSGLGVPAARTLLMLAVAALLRSLARPAVVAPALAAALAAVLCLDPLAPLSSGFWLSFAAVAALMLAGRRAGEAHGLRAALGELLHAQGVVAVALLPVVLIAFGAVSVAGLWVNLLAIPLFSLLLVPLVLGAICLLPVWDGGTTLVLQLFGTLHGLVWPWLQWVADSPWATLPLAPATWWYVLAVPAAFLALLPVPVTLRASTVLLLLLAAAAPPVDPDAERVHVTVFDAGRGQAILVRTAHHALLFDNGETWGSAGAFTRSDLLPALHAYGLRRIDRLYVARSDQDRVSGVQGLMAELPVDRLYAPASAVTPEYRDCAGSPRWQWDGVRFDLLLAQRCVLRVSAPAGSVLIGAFATRADLQELIDRGQAEADAVIVPRNGAATGHLSAFAVSSGARLAVISQTARGAEARTVRRTIADWSAAGATVWVTGLRGALEFEPGHEPPAAASPADKPLNH